MKKNTLFAAFAAIMMMSSCSTSDSALNDLRDLNNRIQIEGATFGYNDWRRAADKYYQVDRKIAGYAADGRYNDAEMQEIGELQGKCISGFAKGLKKNISGKVSNAASLIKGIVKSLKDEFLK